MTRYVLRRVWQALATLLAASVILFMLARVLPGNPAQQMLGDDATPAQVAALEQQLGLDKPVVAQYGQWLGDSIQLDFGDSLRYRRPVTSVIASAFPPTIALLAAAMLIGVVGGVALGCIAGLRQNRLSDMLIMAGTSTIIGVPSFWLGIMALLSFSLWWGWLPPGGWVSPLEDPVASFRSLVLPATTLGLVLASIFARFMRSSVIDALLSPYIVTARSKGIPERSVITRHALRNALIPVLTVTGIQFANLLGGTVIIEQVFAIPGMGRLALAAISARDFPLIQGILLMLVMVFIVVNLLVDVLYGVVDPRVRPA